MANKLLTSKLYQSFLAFDKKIVRGQIYSVRTRADFIYYVEKGAVSIYNYEDCGKKQKNIAFSQDLIGFEGLFGRNTYNDYAQTLTESVTVIPVDIRDFQTRMAKDFDLCIAFTHYLEQQRQLYRNRFVTRASMTSEDFLIQYLEYLAYKIGQPMGYEVLVPIMPNHSAIADILSISRQTVTSTLNKLKKRNSIYYDRKKLIIRHPEGKVINNGVAQG